MSEELRVSAVFCLVADLVIALGLHPLTRYKRPLHLLLDEDYELWINGKNEEDRIADGPTESMAAECRIPACSIAVFRNGWLVAMVDPGGGIVLGPNPYAENELILAIEVAIEKASR